MKRTEYTDEESALKKRRTETTYPIWTSQPWETTGMRRDFEPHFVSLAVTHLPCDGYRLEGHAKFGQILSASSGMASIDLITTKSHCRDSSHKNGNGIGIYFRVPLKIDVKRTDDVYFRLTIDSQEIEVEYDSDMRLNKLYQVNKSGNITILTRHGKDGEGTTETWTIKAIEIPCYDSYTSMLYAALMRQYISKNIERIGRSRK